MDDLLIGYALNALDPADRAAVAAHLAAHPDDAAKVDRARAALQPLEADRDGYAPPPNLAVDTIARAAHYLVENGLLRPTRADAPARATEPTEDVRPYPSSLRPRPLAEAVFPGWGWRAADVVVAGGIAFFSVGLVLSGVAKLRNENQIRACQNQLQEVHRALAGYADTHDGRLPEVGSPEVPVAGAFAAELTRAGQYTAAACPSADVVAAAGTTVTGDDAVVPTVGYSYALGYRRPDGRVTGLRLADGMADLSPVVADLPSPPALHRGGQNVLYVGGAVRFTTTTAAGINGDEIYRNDDGFVRAGLRREDAALGRPTDAP
ncbi:hypothetical protein [Fimbriiglobus ruber]|uniref:Zinc-finger domain-containing protein n=1 Tax=Fimbriiglobus ruber TaxID=1908690 RepID=A0A225DAU5_9BACT|nr:hypothetical protein [Fimbriiglobus ruber]OWK38093.1 hypothetical protein FRUB_07213 [Fimbriiglobus ruber]